jgi:FkbM family methyltransferase
MRMRPFIARALGRCLPPLLARRVGKKILNRGGRVDDREPFEVRTPTGSRFMGEGGGSLARWFSVAGYHDWRNWAVAIALCNSGDTIVEVGANIGTETVGFSDIVGPQGRVVALEPVPANVEALRRSSAGFRYANVSVLPFAAGDREGLIQLDVPPGASDKAHVLRDQESSEATVGARCVTLDSLSEEIHDARMLFIDVEGYEISVLRGARDLLSKCDPDMVIEANPTCLKASGSTVKQLRDELVNLGYRVAAIGRLGLDQPTYTSFAGHQNWLCVRDESRLETVARVIRRSALTPCLPRINPLTRPRFRREK